MEFWKGSLFVFSSLFRTHLSSSYASQSRLFRCFLLCSVRVSLKRIITPPILFWLLPVTQPGKITWLGRNVVKATSRFTQRAAPPLPPPFGERIKQKKKRKSRNIRPIGFVYRAANQGAFRLGHPVTATPGRRQQKRDRTFTVRIRGSSAARWRTQFERFVVFFRVFFLKYRSILVFFVSLITAVHL